MAEGAIGRAAIDFIVGRDRSGTWSAYAIEINLRKGATTHPLYTLELVTGGAYDPLSGTFRAPDGSTAPLRRDGLPRFATPVGAGRRRAVRALGSPRAGT